MKKFLAFTAALVVVLGLTFAVSDNAKLRALSAAMWLEATLTAMERQQAHIDEHDIVYLERKASQADAEVLFLLHGFSADKTNWFRFARHINDDLRIIALDWPAHGESTYTPGADYSIPTQADRLHAFMEHLGISQAHFVGSSMGGAIAADFASRYPQKTLSLILMNSGGADNPATESPMEIALRAGENPLIPETPAEFRQTFDMAMAKPPFVPWPISAAMATMAADRHSRYQAVFPQIHGGVTTTDYAYLERIQAPTLIMWGDQDQLLDVGNAEIFAALIPQNETLIYQGIGHMPMLEVPGQSASDTVRFIQSHR